MGCRCSEISNLKYDISKLKKALGYVGQAEDKKSDVLSELKNASNTFEGGITLSSNTATVKESIKSVYKTASSSVDSAKSTISNAISKAEEHLNSLESEDTSYHEEERKRREHNKK